MNDLIIKEENIKDMIYEVRGKQVMLDSDLAKLYKCSNGTKSINLAVKRNFDRFPSDFYFQLTDYEYNNLRFQNETSNMSRTLPYVFTEQGVAMLATVLRTSVAAQVSVSIMRAFVILRKYISNNLLEQKYINNLVMEHDSDIKLIKESLDRLNNDKEYSGLFFNNQVYDAYSLLLDILGQAKDKITIIDNYIDKNLLDVLSKIDKDILIITNKYNNDDYEKYRKQYSNIKLEINNNIHDRFIIIDDKILYHSGSSFKDLGTKCFAITEIKDKKWLDKLLEWIKN